MRVLLVAGVDLSKPGGVETHVRELAIGLGARGHDVEIAGRPQGLAPFRMVNVVHPGRYDAVHFHAGDWPRVLEGLPQVVATLHFCVASKMSTYVRIGRLRTLANPANWSAVARERRVASHAARTIAVSERVRREFARFHGLDPAGTVVISNGYTQSRGLEDRLTIRARHGVAPDAPVLLTIGRDDFVKGHALLARAWRDLRAANPAAVWVAAGGSEDGTPGRIATGSLPHDQIASWIAAADIGALPSWYEGCSVALLEMLGGGLYTLAHDVGNAAEVIRDGENGGIVAPDAGAWTAALTRALERPHARFAPHMEAFTWSAVVERIEKVYDELASDARLRGGERSTAHEQPAMP